MSHNERDDPLPRDMRAPEQGYSPVMPLELLLALKLPGALSRSDDAPFQPLDHQSNVSLWAEDGCSDEDDGRDCGQRRRGHNPDRRGRPWSLAITITLLSSFWLASWSDRLQLATAVLLTLAAGLFGMKAMASLGLSLTSGLVFAVAVILTVNPAFAYLCMVLSAAPNDLSYNTQPYSFLHPLRTFLTEAGHHQVKLERLEKSIELHVCRVQNWHCAARAQSAFSETLELHRASHSDHRLYRACFIDNCAGDQPSFSARRVFSYSIDPAPLHDMNLALFQLDYVLTSLLDTLDAICHNASTSGLTLINHLRVGRPSSTTACLSDFYSLPSSTAPYLQRLGKPSWRLSRPLAAPPDAHGWLDALTVQSHLEPLAAISDIESTATAAATRVTAHLDSAVSEALRRNPGLRGWIRRELDETWAVGRNASVALRVLAAWAKRVADDADQAVADLDAFEGRDVRPAAAAAAAVDAAEAWRVRQLRRALIVMARQLRIKGRKSVAGGEEDAR
ncbi:hypothetical protein C1H76_8727 [Elsinoe australis]|uniref:Uncharacterized protein n=1 Tax=Elsinoe australis TaxID=40998 RepID=A0A4U7AMQ5_9PEZI|nr:hypothetical protein C1H76_8727 [Elsinoe australis]